MIAYTNVQKGLELHRNDDDTYYAILKHDGREMTIRGDYDELISFAAGGTPCDAGRGSIEGYEKTVLELDCIRKG